MKQLLALPVLAAFAAAACAGGGEETLAQQDVEYNVALMAAQRARPERIGASERIAPEGEPGEPMILRGTAFAADGRAPLADAIVFAYHTDRTGVYRARGEPAHTWRLKGWARTNSEGRFEFATIRPGAYPSGADPEHVHFTIFSADGADAWHAGAVIFEDDPLVGEAERAAARAAGDFAELHPVRRENGAQVVDFRLRQDPRQRVALP